MTSLPHQIINRRCNELLAETPPPDYVAAEELTEAELAYRRDQVPTFRSLAELEAYDKALRLMAQARAEGVADHVAPQLVEMVRREDAARQVA